MKIYASISYNLVLTQFWLKVVSWRFEITFNLTSYVASGTFLITPSARLGIRTTLVELSHLSGHGLFLSIWHRRLVVVANTLPLVWDATVRSAWSGPPPLSASAWPCSRGGWLIRPPGLATKSICFCFLFVKNDRFACMANQ